MGRSEANSAARRGCAVAAGPLMMSPFVSHVGDFGGDATNATRGAMPDATRGPSTSAVYAENAAESPGVAISVGAPIAH